MKKTVLLSLVLTLCLGGAVMAGATDTTTTAAATTQATDATDATDAVSTPSATHYEETSLDKEALFEAIRAMRGGCTVATVNEDGSPNLAVFVPGVADDDHIAFGMAPNTTRDNILRTKEAVISYYIYNPDAGDGEVKYSGARLRVSLQEDTDTVSALTELSERYNDSTLFLTIDEVLPIG